jgi:Tfp pilus assembly protein PilX
MRPTLRGASQRGSMLLLAMFFVLLLAVVGVLVVRHAGRDRIAAAQMVSKERAFACAEAGLQYGRRFFGLNYEASSGWNSYLNGTTPGYKYDPATDAAPTLSTLPGQVRGKSDGSTYDAGTTYNGNPTFWVSIRDDDDEAPSGLANDPTRDNNEAVYVRSECTAFFYVEGAEERTAVVEALLVHVQNASGYGNAQITSNSPDVLGQMGTR